MRKFFFLLTIALLVACNQPARNEVTISGTIHNPSHSEVEVYYYKDLANYKTEDSVTTLDENGSFSITLPLDQPEFVMLRYPRRNIKLYLTPGATLNVQFDALDSDALPVVNGKKALESQFLVNYSGEVENKYHRGMILTQLGSTSADEFQTMLEDIFREKLEFFEGFKEYKKLDKNFVDLMKADFRYEKYGMLLEYPMAFAYFNPEAGKPEMPENYYDFLEETDLFNDKYLSLSAYINFASNYANRKMEEQAEANIDIPFYERQYLAISNSLTGDTREALLSQTMISMLNFGELDRASELFEDFIATVQSEQIKEMVEAEYKKILSLSPGNPAPAFNLSDIDGNSVSLTDFLGKVVYLDFWASWCGPCLHEVPYAKELKERMIDFDDLVFLYLSVDTDEQAWRNTIDEKEISGVHINVNGFEHEVPASYNLKGVPTYYLIGRDGMIYDNRPPRPSSPKIDETLKAALAG